MNKYDLTLGERMNVIESYLDYVTEDEVVTESFLSKAKQQKSKIDAMSEDKLDRYPDLRDLKKWLDRNEKDIEKVSAILDKEATEISDNNVKVLVAEIGGLVSYFGGIIIGGALMAATGAEAVGLGIFGVGVALFFASLISAIILGILNYMKANNDWKYMKQMIVIKNKLVKIDKDNKLPGNLKKQIAKSIDAIADAEEKYNSNVAIKKESAMLEVIEASVSGEISEEERDLYLSLLN